MGMTERQLIKSLLNKNLNEEIFNEIAKIAVILNKEMGLETQSKIVYRLLIQYFEEDLKNSKSYLCQQAKFLLGRGLISINKESNLDDYSFEEVIRILSFYHNDKNEYEESSNLKDNYKYANFWEELSWLG